MTLLRAVTLVIPAFGALFIAPGTPSSVPLGVPIPGTRFMLQASRESVSVRPLNQAGVLLETVPGSYYVDPKGKFSEFLLRIVNASNAPICAAQIKVVDFQSPGVNPARDVTIERADSGTRLGSAVVRYGAFSCPVAFLGAQSRSGPRTWTVETARGFRPYTLIFELSYRPTPVDEQRRSLTLRDSSQTRLAGDYVGGKTGIRFEAIRQDQGDRLWRLNLRTLSDAPLFAEEIPDDTTQAATVSFLGGKFVVRRAAGRGKVAQRLSRRGDSASVATLLSQPAFLLLPDLSRELGTRHNIQGNLFPVSLPLHRLAMRAAKATNYGSCDDPRVAEKESRGRVIATTTPVSATSCSSCSDPKGCPCGSGCYGMCGNGCSCWKWVCGDCCRYQGCIDHDENCRGGCDITKPSLFGCLGCATFDLGAPVFGCKAVTGACNAPTGTGGSRTSPSGGVSTAVKVR